MKQLLIFRHAQAEKTAPGGGDFERALSERGHADAQRMGAYLAQHKLEPQFALVSPAQRAQQTWADAAAKLERRPPTHDDPRIYNAAPDALLAVIATAPAKANLLALVGHNPGLHDIAMHLTASGDDGTREKLREGLPTCGVVLVSFDFSEWSAIAHGRGRLERFLTPAVIDVR